ncbi:MAG TPA: hypothetical protein PKO36_06155 [Candidatus Hydrogenedentes bacterium]|nr:hypothetical protein [Candidatus Hydrogenedentota bacterium]
MKHIGRVSAASKGFGAWHAPGRAYAITDFWNGMWRVWSDFVYQKKNEIAI